jgi:hypothetical protein
MVIENQNVNQEELPKETQEVTLAANAVDATVQENIQEDTEENAGEAKDERIKFVLLDTSTLGRNGWQYQISGADIKNFKKNPVMLYMHQREGDWEINKDKEGSRVIGKWEDIKVEGTQITAYANFDEEDDFAAKIAGKVKRGYLNAVSVGVIPTKYSFDVALALPGQTGPTILKFELLECSIVDIPNFGTSVRAYNSAGVTIFESQEEMDGLIAEARNKGLCNNDNERSLRNLMFLDFQATRNFINSAQAPRRLSESVKGNRGISDFQKNVEEYQELMKFPEKLKALKDTNPEHYFLIANSYAEFLKSK